MAPKGFVQFSFGRFVLDADRHLLVRDGGQPVRLTPKAFDLLLYLVQRHERLVEKDELMKALWPDTFVEDSNLSFNVHQLRKALGGNGDGQQFIETVPRRGYRFRGPVRIVQVGDLASATDKAVREPAESAGIRGGKRLRLVAVTLSIALVVVGSYVFIRLASARRTTQRHASSGASATTTRRPSLAIFDLRNASSRPGDQWLSPAVAEMLFTELSLQGGLRTISRGAVSTTTRELTLAAADDLTPDVLRRIGKNLDTSLLLTGSYTLLGQSEPRPIRIDLRVHDTRTGETVASVAETGVESSLFSLVTDAAVRLREKLQVSGVSAVDAQTLEASLPSNPTALKAYVEGITKLRQFDALAARNLFTTSAAADPNCPLTHFGLSDAWAALGYDENAKAEAKKAFDLSASLDQPQRLWIEASYRRLAHEWDLSLELYRRLQIFFPDDPDYVLQAADVQTSAGKPQDALGSLRAARGVPSIAADPRIDLAEAAAYHQLGDLNAEMRAVKEATRKAVVRQARSLVAASRRREGVVHNSQGRPADAIAAAKAAGDAFRALGNEAGYARTLLDTGNYLRMKPDGRLEERRALYEQALAIYRRTGDRRGEANALNNIGGVFESEGDFVGARRSYQQSLELRQLIDDRFAVGVSLNNLGDVFETIGDLASAERTYESALETFRAVNARENVANALGEIGGIKKERGDLDGARSLLEQSVAEWRAMGHRSNFAADALRALADVLVAQDDLDKARRIYEEALGLTKDMAIIESSWATEMRLGELVLEEGHATEAEAAAAKVRAGFEAAGRRLPQSEVDALLILALLAQGKLNEAERLVVGGHDELKAGAKNVDYRFSVAAARVHAARGRFPNALRLLDEVVAKAKSRGCLECQLKAGLALGEVEILAGKTSAGRATLTSVQSLASARGFLLIARKAKDAGRR